MERKYKREKIRDEGKRKVVRKCGMPLRDFRSFLLLKDVGGGFRGNSGVGAWKVILPKRKHLPYYFLSISL